MWRQINENADKYVGVSGIDKNSTVSFIISPVKIVQKIYKKILINLLDEFLTE